MRNGQLQQQAPNQQQFQINEEYLNQLKTLMKSKNATEYLAVLAQQNPTFKQILQMAQGGGNLQSMFENMARQRGIDPNSVLDKLIN